MKIFIYKTIMVITSVYLLFQVTIRLKLRNYENKVESILSDKQKREQIFDKIKDEIDKANQKENIFTENEKKIFSTFINKIQKELTTDITQYLMLISSNVFSRYKFKYINE